MILSYNMLLMAKSELLPGQIRDLSAPFDGFATPHGFTEFFVALVDPSTSWDTTAKIFCNIRYDAWRYTDNVHAIVSKFGMMIIDGLLTEISDRTENKFYLGYIGKLQAVIASDDTNQALLYAALYMGRAICQTDKDSLSKKRWLLSKAEGYIDKSTATVPKKIEAMKLFQDVCKLN